MKVKAKPPLDSLRKIVVLDSLNVKARIEVKASNGTTGMNSRPGKLSQIFDFEAIIA